MLDRLVADGDRTTTGGEVIGRSGMYNENGKMYARKENSATCGNCKGAWPIYGTADGWMDDGYPMVKDLDWVMCPCRKNRVLAAGSSNALYSENNEETKPTPSPKAHTYDQQYTLRDSDGQPFANIPYRVRADSEILATGVTDSRGMTQRIATQDARRLTFEINGGN
jgi:uncharacterized Zn-binding protein involved in type VI secretion